MDFKVVNGKELVDMAVHKLAAVYDVFILSTAPWKNPSAWSDKGSDTFYEFLCELKNG